MNARPGQKGAGGGSPAQFTASAQVTPGFVTRTMAGASSSSSSMALTSGFATSTMPRTSSSLSSTASATSTASSSNGSKVTAIGQAVGIGLGLFFGGLLLFFVVHWTGRCRTRRYLNRTARMGEEVEKTRKARGNGGMQPMTDGQNSPIGTPNIRSSDQARRIAPVPSCNSPTDSAVELGTDDMIQQGPELERQIANASPPTYAQSQASRSRDGRSSLGQLDTFNRARSEVTISPMTPDQDGDMAFMSSQTDGAVIISPQTSGYSGISYMTRQLTGVPAILLPQYTRQSVDTMGFPSPVDTMDLPSPVELDAQDAALVPPPLAYTPAPRDSLEGLVRRALAPTDSPEPSERHPSERYPSLKHLSSLTRNPSSERYPSRLPWRVSSRISADSSVLGARNQVRIMNSGPLLSSNNAGRQVSQMTVASDSSMGVDIISTEELDRLGVGSKTWHGR